jgi:ADP-ribose pyrophosphatase
LLKKWRLVDSKLLCSSNFLSVFDDEVVLPSDKIITFTRIELRDFVSVLAITDYHVVMVEILRYPRNCLSLEIPSGHIEDCETAKECAYRELEEETGYTARQLEFMGLFHPLSRSTQQAHLFIAKDLKKGMQNLEESEQIDVKLVPISDIAEVLASGKITHPPTLLALQKYLLMKMD